MKQCDALICFKTHIIQHRTGDSWWPAEDKLPTQSIYYPGHLFPIYQSRGSVLKVIHVCQKNPLYNNNNNHCLKLVVGHSLGWLASSAKLKRLFSSVYRS